MAEDGHRRSLWAKLRDGTILGAQGQHPPIPDNIIDTMRVLAEEPQEPVPGQSIHQQVKDRFNRIWGGRDSYAEQAGDASPVSRFRTLRGALTAYWTGEKWAQAWATTGLTLGVATLNAKNTVWVSEAGAAFTNSIAEYLLKPETTPTLQPIIDNAQTLGAFGGLFIGGWMVQDYLKLELQRRMAGWMTGKFNEAVLEKHDTIYRMTHNRDEAGGAPDAMPDGPHQRMSGAISQAVRQSTNFGLGAWGAVMTSAFVGKALYDKSVSVGFLDNMGRFLNEKFPNGMIDFVPGDSGTFALAMATVAAYSAMMFPLALSFGKKLESTGTAIQVAEAAQTESLVNVFSRGQALAESRGHETHKKILSKVYEGVDKAWKADNAALAKYSCYSFLQGFMGYHFVAMAPGLAGAVSRTMDLKGFMESQLYVGSMLQSVGFFFNMIPTVQSMKSAFRRVNGMADMVDRVQDKRSFYELSGTHDFKFSDAEPNSEDILRVRDMALYHRCGDSAFLRIADIAVKKGDYVYIEGESGCGKSSLFRAIAGLYPYGRGDFVITPRTNVFFARQKTDIDAHLTLAEQVVYGAESNALDFTQDKERVEWALRTAGLGRFAESAGALTHEGKIWPEILSGGQEQRLVLARILYQQPDLLLLDEATSALNPEARREFFSILRRHCPETTVMAIMHTDTPGEFPHNKRLVFTDGGAEMKDVFMPSQTIEPRSEGLAR